MKKKMSARSNGRAASVERKGLQFVQKLEIVRWLQENEAEIVGESYTTIRHKLAHELPQFAENFAGGRLQNLRKLIIDYQEAWEIDLQLPTRFSAKAEIAVKDAEIERLRELLNSYENG